MITIKHQIDDRLFGSLVVTLDHETIRLDEINHALLFSQIARFWNKLTQFDLVTRLGMLENGALRALHDSQINPKFFSCIPPEYKSSNELFRSINGPGRPQFYIFPGPDSVFVVLNEHSAEISRDQLIMELEKYGNSICVAIPEGQHSVAKQLWGERWNLSDREKFDVFGMPIEMVSYLQQKGVGKLGHAWYPFLLAARATSGVMGEEDRKVIMNYMLDGGCAPNKVFYLVKKEIQKSTDCSKYALPHDIGYAAAQRFRNISGETGAILPEKICTSFGIPIYTCELSSKVDGISFAAHSTCGIIINSAGTHSKSVQGRKFTLLHELAHLLIEFADFNRGNFEIKMDSIRSGLEKVCNAFAAEALVPQAELEIIAMQVGYSLVDVLELAKEQFLAGDSVVVYQIVNNMNLFCRLSTPDQNIINKWKARIGRGM